VELESKTIIVTGASSGIGAAAARLFASEGANLVLGARRSGEPEALAETINQADGSAVLLAGDVKNEGYADALVDLAIREFGRLDGAFNNVGIVGEMQPVPDMSIDNWTDVISVNLTSAFLAAKAQIPAMKAHGRGSIVFTSSFVGFSNGGMPWHGSLCGVQGGFDRLDAVAGIGPCPRGYTRQCATAGWYDHAAEVKGIRPLWGSLPACIP